MKPKKSTITSTRLQGLFTEIGKVITSSLELPHIIEAIMKQVNLFFRPRNWSLLRLDPEKKELYFVVAKGIDINQIKNVRLQITEGIAGYVARTGESMLVTKAESNPYFSKKIDKLTGFKTKSIIAVPILFNKKVLGVIELINALHDRSFTTRELEILETIADFSAIALTHAMSYEKILWMATHDSLTGLYNLEHLNSLLSKTNVNSNKKKTAHSYSVAVWIDINDLKQVNDYYGHHMGNEVLIKIADLLKNLIDKNTAVIRFGGDEFIIISVGLKKQETKKKMVLLNKKLLSYNRLISPSSGFSFGIALGHSNHLAQIIQDADREMYEHKRAKNSRQKKLIK